MLNNSHLVKVIGKKATLKAPLLAKIMEKKKENGISGYLTDGYYYRNIFDSASIMSAYEFMKISKTSYEKLEKN